MAEAAVLGWVSQGNTEDLRKILNVYGQAFFSTIEAAADVGICFTPLEMRWHVLKLASGDHVCLGYLKSSCRGPTHHAVLKLWKARVPPIGQLDNPPAGAVTGGDRNTSFPFSGELELHSRQREAESLLRHGRRRWWLVNYLTGHIIVCGIFRNKCHGPRKITAKSAKQLDIGVC